jgi:hypothetical protein
LFVIAAAVGFALDAGVLTLLVREFEWSRGTALLYFRWP